MSIKNITQLPNDVDVSPYISSDDNCVSLYNLHHHHHNHHFYVVNETSGNNNNNITAILMDVLSEFLIKQNEEILKVAKTSSVLSTNSSGWIIFYCCLFFCLLFMLFVMVEYACKKHLVKKFRQRFSTFKAPVVDV